MFRSTRQFTRFTARQGSDIFISLYMCSFRHRIKSRGPARGTFRNSFAWLVPSTLILLTVNTREAPSFNLGFSRKVSRKGEANERANEISLRRRTREERRNWERGRKGDGDKGEREKFARTFFGVLSRRRPRSLDTREPAASFRGSLEYYLSGS